MLSWQASVEAMQECGAPMHSQKWGCSFRRREASVLPTFRLIDMTMWQSEGRRARAVCWAERRYRQSPMKLDILRRYCGLGT